MIFFGGLFLGYAIYRFRFPEGFAAAGVQTDVVIGTTNTVLLLTSSVTMAVAVWTGRGGLRWQALFGAGFLELKALEYRNDIAEGLERIDIHDFQTG